MTIGITYHGDFCFEIEMPDSKRILIDPSASHSEPDYIMLTHWLPHWPHVMEIAAASNATVLASRQVAEHIRQERLPLNLITLDLGHSLDFPWGTVTAVYSDHHFKLPGMSSPAPAIGIVLEAEGHRVYHAGPARLHEEMKIIGLNLKPDVSLLPYGSGYLDADELSRAVMWLGSDIMIPMFPQDGKAESPDSADLETLYTTIDLYTPAICRLMQPGDQYSLEPTESSGRVAGPEARY
jgi:L-ascorbate metabolism protein UlaG (beta-lactamase superfamily)